MTATGSTLVFVERWQAGDSEALGALCRRFAPLVRYRLAHHRSFPALSSQFAVEDLEQEVWVRLAASAPEHFRSEGAGSFLAWLSRLVDRTAIDLHRRGTAGKRGGGQEPQALDSRGEQQARHLPGAAGSASPTSEARASEFAGFAAAVLQERELAAWTWVALHGMTSEEAAVGLDTSPAAVRSLLVRSRRRLQEALGRRKSGQARHG